MEQSMSSGENRQRLDKWLWHARIVKTRTGAAQLVTQGHVRVNTKRVEQAAKPVGAGDVLTVAFHNRVVVLEILGCADRRGPYAEASKLYRLIEGRMGPGVEAPGSQD
jgi:ribosome-associated heat shock protein Hsp15